jgi:hypothetical protein
MKPVAKIDENGILRNLRPDAWTSPFPPNTDFYTADQLRQAKVEVLQLAAQRFRGDIGYNPVAADRYANAFDIAAELDYMADEIERSKT